MPVLQQGIQSERTQKQTRTITYVVFYFILVALQPLITFPFRIPKLDSLPLPSCGTADSRLPLSLPLNAIMHHRAMHVLPLMAIDFCKGTR